MVASPVITLGVISIALFCNGKEMPTCPVLPRGELITLGVSLFGIYNTRGITISVRPKITLGVSPLFQKSH